MWCRGGAGGLGAELGEGAELGDKSRGPSVVATQGDARGGDGEVDETGSAVGDAESVGLDDSVELSTRRVVAELETQQWEKGRRRYVSHGRVYDDDHDCCLRTRGHLTRLALSELSARQRN
ncbi:hypothetical protein GUJ93_ZPchr0008g12417 [Zizania palustris]|uniref:Uncharacterized protein n=1 Tax=Zizania palustris TaxID=103762 RepID=A0A8J5V1Z2_ZIZPA|nr:hypothetical protein GUJ93_ZPchr0008g12417 [Zizania palustris]